MRETVVLTIHGTWAKKASWCNLDSQLSTAISTWFEKRGESASIETFEWSGRNSITARQEAGKSLGETLRHLKSAEPNIRIFIVAHSHGGSVVAYALKHDPGVAGLIDGFVALATPWIGVRLNDLAEPLRKTLHFLVLYILLLVGLFLTSSLLSPALQWFFPIEAIGADGFIGKLDEIAVSIVKPIRATLVTTLLVFPLAVLATRRITKKVAQRRSAFEQESMNKAIKMSAMDARFPPSVFFKPAADEAALALNWTSGIVSATRFLSSSIIRLIELTTRAWASVPTVVRVLVVGVLFLLWCIGGAVITISGTQVLSYIMRYDSFSSAVTSLLYGTFYFEEGSDIPWVCTVFWLGNLLASFAFLLLLFLCVISFVAAAACGAPSIKSALYLEFSIEPIPFGSHQLRLMPNFSERATYRAGRGLRHSSIYQSSEAIHSIKSALSEF